MNYLFEPKSTPLLVSHGYQQEPIVTRSGLKIHLNDLPKKLRILLVTDGTVTKTLEAMFCELVSIDLVSQSYCTAPNDAELLERNVKLIGMETGAEYAYARSYLNTDLMPPALLKELKTGNKGIGWLMRQMSHEQYRNIVEIGYNKELPEHQQVEGYDDALFRTYIIQASGSPLMQITEYFPTSL